VRSSVRPAFALLLLLGGCDAPADGPADLAPWPAPYTLMVHDDARITSEQGAPNFQTLRAPIDLKDAPFARATLVVDLRSTCYPFSSWAQNPPPAGQSWPADCDAFDRNFEITLDPPPDPPPGPATGAAAPGIELMRAITPFGGPLHLEIDVTDVANGLPGAHTLQTHITTWSDGAGKVSGSHGGWNVTVALRLEPGAPPRRVLAVLPAFNLSLGPASAGGPAASATLTLPDGTTATRLEYRATGHGGGKDPSCFGPAEEFCERTHHLLLDGAELQPGLAPLREDCSALCTRMHNASPSFDYCLENPCGAIASVMAERANWCPGSLTPPLTWTPELAPGPHTFAAQVDGIADGGSWRLSATLFAFGD